MYVQKMKSLKLRAIRSDSRLQRQQGASLLEGIAYLGIAAIVVMGAISLLTGAFSSAKSNQANEEVIGLRTAVRKLYMGQVYPTTGVVNTLITAKAAPGTLTADGAAGTLKNSWGGTVDVAGNGTGFTITYNAIPKDVCVNMVSGANGWTQMTVNGGTAIQVFPATAADATNNCTSDTSNVVIYTST